MKKKLFLLIAVLLAVGQNAFAYDFSYTYLGQTLFYTITNSSQRHVRVDNPLSSYFYSYITGDVVIPDSVENSGTTYAVTSIGDAAFHSCSGLTSVTIPSSVTSIDREAFLGCSGLTSVTIGNSVTSIGNAAFGSCSGLTSVTFPNSVTSIGDLAFSYCSGLTSVSFPNSVTSIGRYAFSDCSGLTSVTIGISVTSIGSSDFFGCSAFYGCSGLTSIVVEAGNTHYDSRDSCNAIIQTDLNLLIQGCNSTVIPSSVASIGNYAFRDCSGLTSVTIPNSVTSIGNYAFYGCSGLTSIVVEAGNTHYDSRDSCNAIIQTDLNLLIQGCMTTIIPNSVTSIGNNAFRDCSGLTSVTIPNSVTSIGNYAFCDCSNLLNIVCQSVYPPTAIYSAFDGVPAYCTLTVPCGSLADYSATEPWRTNFQNMNEDCPYTVTVVSADSTMGTVSGGGQVQEGDEITITATANAGYRFVRWNDNDTHAVRTVTVTSDMTFTAYFEALPSEGIDDAGAEQIVKVYAADGRIYIDAPQPVEAAVYDMTGRRVATLADGTSVPMPTGVYLVKVGTLPARKVVVLR